VAKEGNLTIAAKRRLQTSQPSLSQQIRDLEYQVGAMLLSRSVHGVELTAAGKAVLDHARLALAHVDAAVEAARKARRIWQGRGSPHAACLSLQFIADRWAVYSN